MAIKIPNGLLKSLIKTIKTTKPNEIIVKDSYFSDPSKMYRLTSNSEVESLAKNIAITRPQEVGVWYSGIGNNHNGWGAQKGSLFYSPGSGPYKIKISNIESAGKTPVILEGSPGNIKMRTGKSGQYSKLKEWEDIKESEPVFISNEDVRIPSENFDIFTKVKDGWRYEGKINPQHVLTIPEIPQIRVVSEGTYPLYVGPKHSVTEVVNPDGTINPRAALKIEREVADNIPGAYRMEARLENPEWHLNDPNTWIHTKNVAKSAWSIPTPNGVTKQDQMIAALGHDFGKIVSGEGHADSSAALLEQIFDDITPKQLTAISEHMGEPKSILGKITKQADILNGEPAITRFVGNNGKIRLRLPLHTDAKPREIVLDPQGNNKFYIHTRTWDGDHVPANMSQQDKQTLYNALYEELPEGGEILFPQSGPGNYATRGTVAGLQRLSRDIRFKPTSNGVLEYIDKDGTIKTFEGTGFKKPKSVISNSRPISFEEKLGLPKSKRNQPVKQGIKSDSRYFLNSEELFPRDLAEIIPDDALVPNLYKQYTLDYKNRKNRGFDIYGWLKEMPEDQETIINNINDFAKTLPDYDPRFAREDGNSSFYITQFRDYLSSLGYETDDISDESILKILTHQYKDLSNGATGKLKGRLVFHGTDQPFESFDYHLTGKNTGNMGYNGAGNYFTTHPSAYGSKRISGFFGPKYQIGWQQPYMITGIKATPLNNGKLSSKLNIPSYISPHGGDYRSVIDNAIKTAELGATKDMAIIDGISVYPPQLFTEEVPVSEFSVARNTGIKSLFPHPSRFIRNEDGTVSLIPTDWSDVRVNFKQGGKLEI